VKELIAKGANTDIQTKYCTICLYTASQNRYLQVVNELISKSANLDIQTNTGESALYIASENGNLNIVDL